MEQVILKIELVEPQWRDEGGPVRGGMGRAEEGELEIWSEGGVSWGGRGVLGEERREGGGRWERGRRRGEGEGRREEWGRVGGREMGSTDRKICFWPWGGRKVFGGRGPSLRVRGGMAKSVDSRD